MFIHTFKSEHRIFQLRLNLSSQDLNATDAIFSLVMWKFLYTGYSAFNSQSINLKASQLHLLKPIFPTYHLLKLSLTNSVDLLNLQQQFLSSQFNLFLNHFPFKTLGFMLQDSQSTTGDPFHFPSSFELTVKKIKAIKQVCLFSFDLVSHWEPFFQVLICSLNEFHQFLIIEILSFHKVVESSSLCLQVLKEQDLWFYLDWNSLVWESLWPS